MPKTKFQTPTAKATARTRRLISATMAGVQGVTINSRTGYNTATKVETVTSLVTYPAGTDYKPMASMARFQGCLSVVEGEHGMSITWAA